MALGIRGQLKALRRDFDPGSRYTDIAIRLEVHVATPAGHAANGVTSQLIGGVYDAWSDSYTDDEPCSVISRPVTRDQFDFCTGLLDAARTGHRRYMGKGGRGGGKTEALAQAVECLMLDRVMDDALGLSPDYPHTRLVWECIIERMMRWLRPGTSGIHTTHRRLTMITGQTIQFLSGHVEKIVRGPGAGIGFVDEEKDIPTAIVDNFIPCIRTSSYFPIILGVGTPEAGTDFEQRWDRVGAEKGYCRQYSFPSKNNCFISGEIWELAKTLMDEKRYRQEVLAEFVELEDKPYICRNALGSHHAMTRRQLADLDDITTRYAAKKTGHRKRYIIGADYNQATPNVAWVYKVYFPNSWVLHDIVRASGKTSASLAQELRSCGYMPEDSLIVDDASGEYDRHKGLQSPNSSSRIMRQYGYKCVHNNKNPYIKDRINAFMAKFAPLVGEPTWHYLEHLESKVGGVLKVIKTDKNNPNKLDKSDGVDHDFDAGTYPVVYFEPAARLEPVQGYDAGQLR